MLFRLKAVAVALDVDVVVVIDIDVVVVIVVAVKNAIFFNENLTPNRLNVVVVNSFYKMLLLLF